MLKKLQKDYCKVHLCKETINIKQSDYKNWITLNENNTLKIEKLDYIPLISVLVSTYNTNEKYLKEMIESVRNQTYYHWELCIADNASSNETTLKSLKKYALEDNQIKIILKQNHGNISKSLNHSLSLASGIYVIILNHNDLLAPNALYEIVKKLNANRNLKFIYSDEDKIDKNSRRFMPHFKPAWNPEMFYSKNYIGNLIFLEKKIVNNVKGFNEKFKSSQDYDLILRCLGFLKESEIDRIEKVLYHKRIIKESTKLELSTNLHTHNNGRIALEEYFKNKNKDTTVENGLLLNTYKINYPLFYKPLVSLLIPTRDGYDILSNCIQSILEKTTYTNYEIIVIDNQTTCKKTLEYFERIKENLKIRIIKYHHPFNYSAINNYAVKHAHGELIALINNDTEVISPNWLEEMIPLCIKEGTGAVGAKLYYANDKIQHAGIILGIGGVAGYSHKYFNKDSYGYFSRLKIVQNYSAITGACLLVRKKVYLEVAGLDEKNLKIAFNDVDFCLKLLERGYKNIWTPYSELYHYESISREKEDDIKKINSFMTETKYMKKKWFSKLEDDLAYNCSLTNKYEDFGLRSK